MQAMLTDARTFDDRRSAGIELGRAVSDLRPQPRAIVLGLPRGGVPVAYEVAKALGAPLDVMIVRKVGMPTQPELAIGAVASGGITVRDPPAAVLGITDDRFEQLAQVERTELERRECAYRGGRPPLELEGKCVVLVDDGIATGATMLAALLAARKARAASVIVAAPVASVQAAASLETEADATVILTTPRNLFAIGQFYRDFAQLTDEDVREVLERAQRAALGSTTYGRSTPSRAG
jgi:putative phosphoribosyl transferase